MSTANKKNTSTRDLRPSGLHHVAFATRDVEATYDFYAKRLGMKLVHTENHAQTVGDKTGWMRHFFFDMGEGASMAFFEVSDVGEDPDFTTDVSTGAGLPVWVNHVAFKLHSLDELIEMRERCRANDVELLMETDHGWCHSIYMVDPNGIMVEFSVTTKPDEFAQSENEALRLLRLPSSEFAEDESIKKTQIYASRETLKSLRPKKPRS